jgi:hypothetical protein
MEENYEKTWIADKLIPEGGKEVFSDIPTSVRGQ